MTKITSSIFFFLSLDALAGSGTTEDEETTATSGPDEAVKAGRVTECLIHATESFSGDISADISDTAKMHKYNTKAVILTTQSHLISLLEVTN